MTKDRTEERRRWWRREGVLPLVLLLGVPPLLFGGLLVLAMIDNPIGSRVDERMVFGDGDTGEIVVVTYERQGDRNPLALPHWIQTGYDRRATAVSTSTGEQLWDVSVDYWWPQGETAPLALGGGRVYVVVEGGLVILDAADGSQVAGPDEIDGLGTPVLEAQGAYGYDAESGQVVALTADGDIVGIPLGADAATPVGRDVLDRWDMRLDTEPYLPDADAYPYDGFPYEDQHDPDPDPCEDASGPCAVSPDGVPVEVERPVPGAEDYLETLVVGGVRTELGTQGQWW